MKTTNFMTTRIWTLAIAAFAAILIASGTHISAKAGYFDTAMNATEFFGQFISSENAPAHPDAAGIGVFDWSGGDGSDANWTSNDNWAGVLGAGPGDDLIFPDSASRKINTNDFTPNTEFRSLTFTGSDYVISGNQISLTNGIVTNLGTGTLPIFNPNIQMSASQTFTSVTSGFSARLTGTVNLQSFNLTLTGAGNHSLEGQIAATTGDLFKQGNGTVSLTGNSPNAPQLHVNDGMATIGGNAVWNDSADVDTGGTLYVIGDIGNITLLGGRLISFGTTNTVGAVSVSSSGGTIAPGPIPNITSILTSTGAVTNSGGALATFEFDINGPAAGTQHDRLTSTGGNINLGGANLDVSLGFTPTGGQQFAILTTSGAGNTITGQFAQGTSIVASGQIFAISYGPTSVVLTNLGSSLTWDGGGTTNNWSEANNWSPNFAPQDGLDLVFPASASASSLTNTNDIVALEVDRLTFTGNDYVIVGNAITSSGGIVVNTDAEGSLGPKFNPNITLAGAQTFSNNGLKTAGLGGTLNLNGFGLTVNGTNNFNFSGQVTGAGGITKTGAGTLFLPVTGNNNYTGTTTINGGFIDIQSANSLGATGAGNGTVVASGATLVLQNNILNVLEAITLNGTGVSGFGALYGGCPTGCSISAAITLASDSAIGVQSAGDTLTLNGTISGGTNGLTKVGEGTLILTAANPYNGTTTVNAGTLLANGNNVVSPVSLTGGTLGGVGTIDGINATGGTVAPGQSPGTLTSGGNVSFNAATTFNVEIGGLNAGTQYDRLSVTSPNVANLGGANLTGSFTGGFNPAPGNQFIIVTAASITGQFAQGNSITIGGRAFSITYNPTSVVLTALPVVTGTVTYGNAAAPPKFISNATVTASGSPNIITTTAAPGATAGQYSLSGFGAGSYTVSLSKTTGQNSITSNDAARIAQHVAGTSLLTTNNQKVSADVTGNGAISSQDAAKIAQFAAGLPFSPPNLTSTWQFYVSPGPTFPVGASPTSRTYASVTNNIAGNDYIGLLIGEVTGNWTPSAARPVGNRQSAEKSISVTAPNLVTPADSEVVIAVEIQGAADKGIISYEFNLRYDPSVIQPQKDPVDIAKTVSSGLSAVANPHEPGLLRVAVYGPTAIDSDGILLNLRFTAVGAAGSLSPLTFERIMLNEDESIATVDGQIEVSKADSDKAEITGRLLTALGEGVALARVTLTDTTGNSRSVVSNSQALYRFGGLQIGQTYTLSVDSRSHSFTPLTISVTGGPINVDIIAEQ